MDRKLQVFVSSTFTDMMTERQAAVEAILRAGHIPAGMELFAAGDQAQLEVIRTWIDESDVFMLILGGRYGTIEEKSRKSYIQLEYEYAVEKNKPHFAAVMSEMFLNAKIQKRGKGAKGKAVIETDNPHLFKAFQETVKSKICRFFNDANELKLIVFESLGRHDRDTTLSGWVKGWDADDLTDRPSAYFLVRLRVAN